MSDGYFLLLFLIPLFAAIWVYTDAREKQVPGAAGWAILTFFILIIGLPLYLVSGRKQAGLAGDRSSIARSQLLSGGRVCTQCGLTIVLSTMMCPGGL
jgi:hypothetical protein